MPEIWKPIPGYEEEYHVSDLGRVLSLPRYVYGTRGETKFKSYRKGRLLKPGYNAQGYLTVSLNRRNTFCVHKLVAMAFLEKPEGKVDVMHLDGSRDNNTLPNLRYGTRSENNKMTTLHGRRKITTETVRYVRESKIPISTLSKELNLSLSALYNIRAGRTRCSL